MKTLRASLLLSIVTAAALAAGGCDMFLPDAGGYGQRCLSSDEHPCAEGLVAETGGGECWCLDPQGQRCRDHLDCSGGDELECADGHCRSCTGPESCLAHGFGNCMIDQQAEAWSVCVGCLVPADCPAGQTCNPDRHECDSSTTACTDNADCPEGPLPRCYPDEGVCGPCQEDGDCAPQAGFSDHCQQGVCVECLSPADCPQSQACTDGHCERMCQNDGDCTSMSETPICNAWGFCAECKADADCAVHSDFPQQCQDFFGRCAECLADADCAAGERCRDQRFCVACLSDGDCPDGGHCVADRCTACRPGSDSDCAAGQICAGGECLAGQVIPIAHQSGEYPQPVGNLAFGHSATYPTLLAYGHRGEAGGVLGLSEQGIGSVVAMLQSSGTCDPFFVFCATEPIFRPAYPAGQLLVGLAQGSALPAYDPWTYWLYEAADNFFESAIQSDLTTRMAYLPDGQGLVSLDVSDNGDNTGNLSLVHRDLTDLHALADPAPIPIFNYQPLSGSLGFALVIGPDGSQIAAGFRAVNGAQAGSDLARVEIAVDENPFWANQCPDGPDCGWSPHLLAFSRPASGPATYLAAGGSIDADGPDYDRGWLTIWDVSDQPAAVFSHVFQDTPSEWTHRPMGLAWIGEDRLLVLTREGRLRVFIRTGADDPPWAEAGRIDLFGYPDAGLTVDTPAAGLAHDPQTDWLALGGSDELKILKADDLLQDIVGLGAPCTSDADCPAAFPLCAEAYGTDTRLMCTRACQSGVDADCQTPNVPGVCTELTGTPLCTAP